MTTITRVEKKLSVVQNILKTALVVDIDAICSDLKNNTVSAIKLKDKGYAWLNVQNEDIQNIDKLIRQRFKISNELKLVFSLYEDGAEINKNNETIFYKVFLSNVDIWPKISFGDIEGDVVYLAKGNAHCMPSAVSGVLAYKFTNENKIKLPEKKGHRSRLMKQNVSDRKIFVFDYYLTTEQLKHLTKQCNTTGDAKEKLKPEKLNEILNSFKS